MPRYSLQAEGARDSTRNMTESAYDRLAERLAEDIGEDRLELPGFPEAVLRVQRAMESPEASAEDVVRVLSSEPALAARAVQMANAVQFRRSGPEVTDLKTAVARLGFNLVRSLAVAYAIQQLRLRGTYSPAAKAELESIWRTSIAVAVRCYVIAKHCAGVNPDEALLAGLLHVLGRLYIVMRAEGIGGTADAELASTAQAFQGEIGKLILASWGLPETLQHAVEHQDDLDHESEGPSITDVLIVAKHLAAERATDEVLCPVADRLAEWHGRHPTDVLGEHADELRDLTRSFMQ